MDFNPNGCLKTSLNWLIPHYCIVCNQQLYDNSPFQCCMTCYEKLPFLTNACQQCGQSIHEGLDYCGQCLLHPPAYDQCFCPFRYEAPIKTLIQQFKYQEKPETSKLIARLFHQELINNDIALPELLIPVPLHINRLRERGFNQALLLTKEVSQLLQIPYSNNMIYKQQTTNTQAQLSFKQRKNNLSGSFSFNNSVNKEQPRHIAILDDVITTGATMTEITKILNLNGVQYVSVWGVAHTMQ